MSTRGPLQSLLERKRHAYADAGFEPLLIPAELFDFQKHLVEWTVRKGRGAIYAECGMGKSAIQLTWAENVVRKTARPVLVLTPLAVAAQMVREAEKFGIEASRSIDGWFPAGARIVVTNYERLHHFNATDFAGVSCDESSILKNCDGVTRAAVTDFLQKLSYRLLCTATPSPNDLIELGTSSEALGYMGFSDMLSTFFKKAETAHTRSEEFRSGMWRFRGHAEPHFFRWVCSWARALRKPSDMGFSDDRFILPALITRETIVKCETAPDGFLFSLPAVGLQEQRSERRRSLELRCEAAADVINANHGPSVAWCYLNDEGKSLTRLIPGAVEVAGSDSMEFKEESFEAFASGQLRVLVTKPEIAGFGLNWQHCAHQTFFPSHSFEQYYQAVRRSWRFGQQNPVTVDLISSEGERGVMANLQRKAQQAEKLFDNLVRLMGEANSYHVTAQHHTPTITPSWLS